MTCCCDDIGTVLEPRFFKALCDPMRLSLLASLAQRCEPCTVSEIATCCPIDISVVSRHLAMLKEAGILEAEKQGKEVYYSVPYKKVAQTLRSIADTIESCCVSNDQVNGE
ncbi:metalloregulator ArsR/SmtB family transcription factor [Oligoflexia bacterium]|nr:metalloregulator ArsR/SmtB family transcription factor [Oligoflexia bacterium]